MNFSIVTQVKELEAAKPFISASHMGAFCKNSTHLLGFCFDGTTSYRPGARFGPDALRDASFGLETFSPYQNTDLEDYSIIDMGNLPIYPSKWKVTNNFFHMHTKNLNLKEDKIKIVTLGGEHSISYGPIRLHLDQYSDLLLIHLDAHADLRDGYLDEKYSHASVIRRIWNHLGEKQELIQYGIRSGTREEFVFMHEHKTLSSSLEGLLAKLLNTNSDRPIYLTLDLDFFDPSFFPGTGTPEAGGEDFHNFIKIIKCLKDKNFVGADIVELAPMIDSTGNSAAFAAKVTREVLLALQ